MSALDSAAPNVVKDVAYVKCRRAAWAMSTAPPRATTIQTNGDKEARRNHRAPAAPVARGSQQSGETAPPGSCRSARDARVASQRSAETTQHVRAPSRNFRQTPLFWRTWTARGPTAFPDNTLAPVPAIRTCQGPSSTSLLTSSALIAVGVLEPRYRMCLRTSATSSKDRK